CMWLWLVHEERCVWPHPIPVAAPQEAAHRLRRCLSQNVPQGDIDAADRVRETPAPPHPERVLMKLLADALRRQRVLVPVQRLHHGECGPYQPGVGKDAAGSGQTLVRADDDEG